ncbi:hypothetical protein XBJ1_0073 [Xenorhabdus bovienii SS-2004]|uniref:Uncharacterized protein n=1 Tax=Xenorhabdus bovienii (strain SS-2004) TaxID=406818 RepID=D3UY46_XENBS|nr:hypothetical protein XBJ1_0073 [Xenorhabdus bovienii SS-2004]
MLTLLPVFIFIANLNVGFFLYLTQLSYSYYSKILNFKIKFTIFYISSLQLDYKKH